MHKKILVQRPQGRRPHGRLRHKWENIKMDLKNKHSKGLDWIQLAQDKDQWQVPVKIVMKYTVS
jgi:hypothetical protein